MGYSISQCYKDLENKLNRPINITEFEYVKSWFDTYPSEFIQATFIYLKNARIYKASYISTTLSSWYPQYLALQEVRNEVIETTQEETPKKKTWGTIL